MDLWEAQVKGKKGTSTYEFSVVRKSNEYGHRSWGWFDTEKLLVSHNNESENRLGILSDDIWDRMVILTEDVAHYLNVKEFGPKYADGESS